MANVKQYKCIKTTSDDYGFKYGDVILVVKVNTEVYAPWYDGMHHANNMVINNNMLLIDAAMEAYYKEIDDYGNFIFDDMMES